MSLPTLIATTLALSLITTGILYARSLKPIHDPSHDDAELDDLHVASVARRGRGFASFHSSGDTL